MIFVGIEICLVPVGFFETSLRYESAAGICDGSGPGGPAAAMLHWEKAHIEHRRTSSNQHWQPGGSLLSTGGQGRCGSQGEVTCKTDATKSCYVLLELVPCCQLLLKVAGVREKPGLSWAEHGCPLIQKQHETAKTTPLPVSKSVCL